MIKVKLGSKGCALIDDEDFEKISHCAWFLQKDTHNQYAKNKKHQSMHRIIMGAKEGEIIDHRDGDGLNNQKSNLRICTQAQNVCNKTVSSKPYTLYLGVFKEKNKWVAGCKKDGKLYRSRWDTEREAAIAYNEMAIKFHGDYARLNQIH